MNHLSLLSCVVWTFICTRTMCHSTVQITPNPAYSTCHCHCGSTTLHSRPARCYSLLYYCRAPAGQAPGPGPRPAQTAGCDASIERHGQGIGKRTTTPSLNTRLLAVHPNSTMTDPVHCTNVLYLLLETITKLNPDSDPHLGSCRPLLFRIFGSQTRPPRLGTAPTP